MMRCTYGPDGALLYRERADDESRTVTTWDAQGTVTGTRPYTDAENAAADAAIAATATLTDLAARVARIEAKLWPPQPDTTPAASVATLAAYGGVWPVGGLLVDGGKTWRNISGVPLTTAPTAFPGGPERWSHLFVLAAPATQPPPPAGTIPDWSATATYAIGDKVTRNGVTYRCLVAHGAAYQGTWGPPLASVWAVA